jgi:hypothetical protein
MASFLLISACGQSSDDTADAEKTAGSFSNRTSNAYNATKEMAEDVAESTSKVIDATTKMANDVANSAIEMKDKMMEDDKLL